MNLGINKKEAMRLSLKAQCFLEREVHDHQSNLIFQYPLITIEEMETQRSEVACFRTCGYLNTEIVFFKCPV